MEIRARAAVGGDGEMVTTDVARNERLGAISEALHATGKSGDRVSVYDGFTVRQVRHGFYAVERQKSPYARHQSIATVDDQTAQQPGWDQPPEYWHWATYAVYGIIQQNR